MPTIESTGPKLGWLSLRLRGRRWGDVGLARFGSWSTTLALGVVVGVGMELFACRRKLAVPIVAHGVTDSLDVLLTVTGLYPGLPAH